MLLVDSEIYAGNKVMAVTGALDLYGTIPSNVITRLSETAAVGATVIKVVSASGWVAGD